ncbi:MAG: type II secretion system F family protein [Nitrospirales bacterium]|nr:type II secretion system F family protein [Nitrospirales bacterium]NKB82772.1 type II secretion system F family protein [Nitrospirales bacterium]
MPQFHYRAARADGTIIEDQLEAENDYVVRTQLETRGLVVLHVAGKKRWGGSTTRPKARGHLSHREFLVFNQQFLALVKAGLPILKAFDILTDRATHGNFQVALQDVREEIRGGSAISQAMATQPKHFPDLYRATIQSGEQTGNLAEVLQRYIAYLKLIIGVREKTVKALAYPGFLIIVGIGVVGFLLTYVIPTFSEVYAQSHAALPFLTQMLLDLINSIQIWLPWIFGLTVMLAVALYSWVQTSAGRTQYHWILLRVPLLGDIILKSQIIRLARTLGTIIAGGIPLLSALTITANAMTNKIISRALIAATDHVRDGTSLAASLNTERFLPRMTIEMIEVGETTGSLETMLHEIAEFHEGELNLQLDQLTTWIEPILLLIMGVIIGGIVIIMYLPIFQLAGTV